MPRSTPTCGPNGLRKRSVHTKEVFGLPPSANNLTPEARQKEEKMAQNTVSSLIGALADGAVEVVDLTQPLSERTPVIKLPEQFAQTPGLKVHEISGYDERGPAWAWNWLEIGEHVGTHLDAPIHWVTGRDGLDVSRIPPQHLVAPAVVIDKTAESEGDPDFLLTVEDIKSFESEHGPLPEGGWLLFRTGWDVRAHDEDLFLNAQDGNPRSPGL